MRRACLLVPEAVLTMPGVGAPEAGVAVLVEAGTIAAVGPADALQAGRPDAERIELRNCLVMPGLVNAHQHGRGLSQIQLGYPDARLELWINQRRARGVPDPYALGLLAAAEMLRHGVTCAVHANISYGSGDYETEVRAGLRAYVEAGLRVTMCIGAVDRGLIVYPDSLEQQFLRGLPAELRDGLAHSPAAPYAGDAAATAVLMDRLMHDYAGEALVRFCFGPAGPQWVSDEMFGAIARDAERRGLGIHLHALESAAQAAACRRLYPEGTFARLDRLGVLGPRTVVAHGVYLTDQDMEVLARRGATVVTNPGSNLRLGNGVARVADMQRSGIRVAVGTDNTAHGDDEDLLGEARLAALLARGGTWSASPPPDAAAVLAMVAGNGAVAAQWQDRIGRIAPGYSADLVAISLARIGAPYLDPDMSWSEALVARAGGRDIRLTMVDGRVLYHDGRFPHLDMEAVRSAARRTALSARRASDPRAGDLAQALRPHLQSFYEALAGA
jgi:cytosine/adenosine deaminase-related metal-dependent hydrolase